MNDKNTDSQSESDRL